MKHSLAWPLGLAAGLLALPAPAPAQQPAPAVPAAEENPFAGDPAAVAEGRALFLRRGCAGCHGSTGQGETGPSLADAQWMYGETDADLFRSIRGGRPKGMPAWGTRMGEDQIWKVIAYVRSLAAGAPR